MKGRLIKEATLLRNKATQFINVEKTEEAETIERGHKAGETSAKTSSQKVKSLKGLFRDITWQDSQNPHCKNTSGDVSVPKALRAKGTSLADAL